MCNVCSGYKKTEILHNINLKFEENKITSVIGPNGCGKSTLLKTIMRLVPVSSGEIIIDGLPLNRYTSIELAKKTAYLPQDKLIPDMTVMQMVLHGRFAYLTYPKKYSSKDIKIAEHALKTLDLLNLKDKNISELSGGQRQKAYIAMALAQQSPVILMDEPTTYLDIVHQLNLAKTIKEISDKTIISVLHDLPLALKLSDYICVMHNGNILQYGTPAQIVKSGVIDMAFGIKLKKFLTESGIQYFCEI